jgi:quercetin dioxygenase-like cupin family protein
MRLWHLAMTAALALSYGIAPAQTMNAAPGSAAAGPTIVTLEDTKWTPGTGMMKGVDVAVLSGDPSKSGPYVVRLRIPANTKLPPHFHGDTENVTIISGALWVGVGDKYDESKMQQLGPGAFVSVPANLHHYAMTKTETVIQIHGVGPESMTAVENM